MLIVIDKGTRFAKHDKDDRYHSVVSTIRPLEFVSAVLANDVSMELQY